MVMPTEAGASFSSVPPPSLIYKTIDSAKIAFQKLAEFFQSFSVAATFFTFAAYAIGNGKVAAYTFSSFCLYKIGAILLSYLHTMAPPETPKIISVSTKPQLNPQTYVTYVIACCVADLIFTLDRAIKQEDLEQRVLNGTTVQAGILHYSFVSYSTIIGDYFPKLDIQGEYTADQEMVKRVRPVPENAEVFYENLLYEFLKPGEKIGLIIENGLRCLVILDGVAPSPTFYFFNPTEEFPTLYIYKTKKGLATHLAKVYPYTPEGKIGLTTVKPKGR